MMALRNAAAHGPSGNSTATSFTAANRRPVVPTSISTAAGGVSRGTAPVPPRRAPPSSSSTTVRPQATRARPAAPSAATPASSTTQQPPHQTVSNTIGTAIRSLFASPFLGTTSTSSSSSQQQSNTRPASVSTRPASRVSTRPASVSTRPASVATRPATVSTTSVRRPQSSSGFNSTTITSAEVPVRSRSRILDTNRGGQEVPSRGTAARSGPGTSSSSTTAAPPPPPATAFSTSSEAESSSATSVSPSKSRGRHVTGALEERKRSKK
ncbi:unnamed protein product [Amoebophrya sp. A25]|nr:unnamed protein product [Amoebophrya sp. A25]|eukprot:GSA25T00007168001.1